MRQGGNKWRDGNLTPFNPKLKNFFDMCEINEEEVWKDIAGYEGMYQISSYGRVKSLSRKRVPSDKILKQSINVSRYACVNFIKDKKKKTFNVHRLIATAFISNPGNKPCLNHKDGNKKNNAIDNLDWCTHSENLQHAFDTGLRKYAPRPKLERASNSRYKLPPESIEEIFLKLSLNKSCRSIADYYNVTEGTIVSAIRKREQIS